MRFDSIRRMQHSLRDMVTTALRRLDGSAGGPGDVGIDRRGDRLGDAPGGFFGDVFDGAFDGAFDGVFDGAFDGVFDAIRVPAAPARTQAGIDAALLHDAMVIGPGETALASLERATRILSDINARIEYGAKLTPAEATYIATWISAVGAIRLGRLHHLVDRSLEAVMPGRSLSIRQAAVDSRLGPVADAILNYSNPARHQPGAVATDGEGRVSLAAMPRAIQLLLRTRSCDPGQVGIHRPTLCAWSRLLACASESAVGGHAFSLALARQALAHCGDEPYAPSASRLLSVAARHDEAAADLLVDANARSSLLSHRWTDDRGLIDLIIAGTDREPAEDNDTALQADAAQALIIDVGRQAQHYLDVMTPGTAAAIVDVGLAWIDPVDSDPVDSDPVDSGAAEPAAAESGFRLTPDAEVRFLRFVTAAWQHSAGQHLPLRA